jgi:hypothetical protein
MQMYALLSLIKVFRFHFNNYSAINEVMIMNEFTPNSLWLIGFIVLFIVVIGIVLTRNKAAKTDSVNRTERDTIANSVSISPPDSKRKIG